MKILVFGNSASGKSTLAARLARRYQLAHLDLDTVAFAIDPPTQRRLLADSMTAIHPFLADQSRWVIEGGYADILQALQPLADELIYLDLPLQHCLDNARARPWEPHKYASRQAQDDNLPMLLEWIRHYESRQDYFSAQAHRRLFEQSALSRHRLTSNRQSQQFTFEHCQ